MEAARSFNQALTARSATWRSRYAGLSIALTELNAPAASRDALARAGAGRKEPPITTGCTSNCAPSQSAAEDAGSCAGRIGARTIPGGASIAALETFPADEELLAAARPGRVSGSGRARAGQHGVCGAGSYDKARTLGPAHFAAHHYLTHAYENSGRIKEAALGRRNLCADGARRSARPTHVRPQPASRRP